MRIIPFRSPTMTSPTHSSGEKMPDISSLNAEIDRLTQSVGFWNSAIIVLMIGVAAVATGLVIAQQMAFRKADALSRVTDQLSNLKEAASEQKIIGLQKDASDAKGAQQKVETELAKQKERTAAAEKSASDAALALAKFKQPRSLSPDQQDALIEALKPFVGQPFACAVFPDPEPLALLRTLDLNLKSAGWKRVPSQIERPDGVLVEAAGNTAATIFDSGIDVYVAPDDTTSVSAQSALCLMLRNAGIACETHRTPQLAGKTPEQ